MQGYPQEGFYFLKYKILYSIDRRLISFFYNKLST